MREIKFRGKRIDNGEWVYGSLVYDSFFDNPATIVYYERYEALVRECAYKIDPESVGQYTGLKDAKGRDVYEGDVLKAENTGKVYYEDAQWFGACDYLEYAVRHGAEIIGTIHDTKDGDAT